MGVSNIELGPCQVKFGTELSEVDIGLTEGGVNIKFETQTAEHKTDQNGETPVDETIIGQKVTVSVPLTEVTFRNYEIALNQIKKVSAGKSGIAGASLIGTKLSAKAASLLLIKYENGIVSSDTQDRFRFPVAAPSGTLDIGFNKNNQRIIQIEFKCFQDLEGYWYYIGDETAAVSGS